MTWQCEGMKPTSEAWQEELEAPTGRFDSGFDCHGRPEHVATTSQSRQTPRPLDRTADEWLVQGSICQLANESPQKAGHGSRQRSVREPVGTQVSTAARSLVVVKHVFACCFGSGATLRFCRAQERAMLAVVFHNAEAAKSCCSLRSLYP